MEHENPLTRNLPNARPIRKADTYLCAKLKSAYTALTRIAFKVLNKIVKPGTSIWQRTEPSEMQDEDVPKRS